MISSLNLQAKGRRFESRLGLENFQTKSASDNNNNNNNNNLFQVAFSR